jgi:integrase
VKLLLLTGQRAEEIAGLSWSEIDLDRGVIKLPGERTKNHRPHTIPLAPMAADILAARERRKDRDLVFGTGNGGFDGWSKAKVALDAKLNIAAWRIHDLRRTAATGMADVGIQPHVIEAVLNHVSGSKAGVAGIYNRSDYKTEKASALALWANQLSVILGGRPAAGNVRPMRRAI